MPSLSVVVFESGGGSQKRHPRDVGHHYRNSLRLYGDHSATLGRLGTCLAELGETDEALELAKRALSLDPNSRTANALFEWLEEESSELAMYEE